MPSSNAHIIQDEDDIAHALAQIGLSEGAVIAIARATASARAEALQIDPVSAAGWFSYVYGVRHIRLRLLSKNGWRMSRIGNVESTVNDELGIQLCFQNVDSACNPNRVPHAVSGKGTAARQLVADGQGELFAIPSAADSNKYGCVPTVWVICVEANDTSLKVEVSCPTSFEGSQFEDFHKRIFVFDEYFEDLGAAAEDDDADLEEFDVPVSKK